MKAGEWGGSREYMYGTQDTAAAMSEFAFANMSSEAVEAVRGRVITPTVTEVLRLAGIKIDGQPPLEVDELIGPRSIGELNRSDQAFYFSGPKHPVLEAARDLPTFLTYRDILDVHGDMGITQSMATKNFRGLVAGIFKDEKVKTHGVPGQGNFERKDGGSVHMLHRFAVRRRLALMAMTGEYQVNTGKQDIIFNGYGKALIGAIYRPGQDVQRISLDMELESRPEALVARDDPRGFKWGEDYVNFKGDSHRLNHYDFDSIIPQYIGSLLTDIGADTSHIWWKTNVTEDTFVTAIEALCTLDGAHTKAMNAGHPCTEGVHYKGLTNKAVIKAKLVAGCITEAKRRGVPRPNSPEEEINLDDPGLQSPAKEPTPLVVAKDFDW